MSITAHNRRRQAAKTKLEIAEEDLDYHDRKVAATKVRRQSTPEDIAQAEGDRMVALEPAQKARNAKPPRRRKKLPADNFDPKA